MRKVLGFLIAATMPFAVAGAILTPRGVTVSLPEPGLTTVDQLPVVAPGHAQSDADDPDGSPDLLGNPVSDAVAKYKFDATGSLYELHSPQTELPRLGSPKS